MQLQARDARTGPLECARRLLREDGRWPGGARALYKGFTPPLLAQSVYKSVLFSVNAAAHRGLGLGRRDARHIAICGSISGATNSLVVTPVELVRNQLIMQGAGERRFASPLAVVRHVWALRHPHPLRLRGGFIYRMYRGLPVTATRDSLGVAMWFTGFHLACEAQKGRLGLGTDDALGVPRLLLSGACGGVSFWVVALPFDAIKSRIQCAPLDRPAVSVMEALESAGGLRNLYRGWQVAIGRGVPGAAITLTVHHEVAAFLSL